ncbi:response regulator [Pyxidicoccus parkwayensis]|uniref:Response regulator n=1 Tax=Pyxidicoccus parkwayensis TaxID=2813578 RepID=A0ABX7P148_9BACT|nr:response regulator [Pyxidicoccus parkwaysis]QSQ22118.1 response regulator [Pyxidicoccus parkwaysis]
MAVVTHALARPMVLLVEDDPDVRGAMAEALHDEGYEVAMAINGHEGLRVLAALDAPCLVLLDLEIPRGDGHAFVERLNTDARFAGTQVLGMTGELGPPPPGVVAMLRKPVKLGALLEAVERHCPRRDPATSSSG